MSKYTKLDPLETKIDVTFRIAVAALILAILLAGGLSIGFGVGFGNRIDQAEQALTAMTLRTSQVEMQLLELVMNTSSIAPVYTTRISGTFEYAFQANTETVIAGSAFRLRDVTIGPLNFTLLELNPPTAPYVFPATFVTDYRVKLRNFVPSLEPSPLFADQSNGYPLTQGNINRISISGGCFQAGACILRIDNGDGVIPNTILFRNPGLTTATTEIQFYFGPAGALVGESFTLSSPWMFLIPSF